jgi:hypothetical protein
MKHLITCFLLLMAFRSSYSESVSKEEIQDIKKAMLRAVESSSVTDSLYNKLVSKKSKSALIIAYVGTLEALKAKHSWNPYNKIKYVAQSRSTMKIAIDKESDNLEIRFLRFSIQHYTPGFLGYSKELEEDRKAIVTQFTNKTFGTDQVLIQSIADFMIKSKRCSASEILLFKKYV